MSTIMKKINFNNSSFYREEQKFKIFRHVWRRKTKWERKTLIINPCVNIKGDDKNKIQGREQTASQELFHKRQKHDLWQRAFRPLVKGH